MSGLTRVDSGDPRWYPVEVRELTELLKKVIRSGRGYEHAYALRKNIAYNLQYVEFLDRCLSDISLSSVLERQTWKMFIVVGCGIVESLLHFLLIARGLHSTTEWELHATLRGNPKTVDGDTLRADTHLLRRLDSAQLAPMTFDAMLKKAEAKTVLGSDHSVYAALKRLRPLRNRVHLQAIESPADTDWNAFTATDLGIMAEVLYKVFTSTVFRPSNAQKQYFAYLHEHFNV